MRANPPRRRLAKFLFWMSGVLAKVKTPQWTYQVVEWGPPLKTARADKRTWMSCHLSMRVLNWSIQLDWWHWSHWATVHTDCNNSVKCAVCDGWVCEEEDE